MPTGTDMKDLKKFDPRQSLPSMVVYHILNYRWCITILFFIFASLAMIIIVIRSFTNKDEKKDEEIEEEGEIYLEGRKLLLPNCDIFKSGDKFHLSEEFEGMKQKKELKDMYKDTLITKLKLSS